MESILRKNPDHAHLTCQFRDDPVTRPDGGGFSRPAATMPAGFCLTTICVPYDLPLISIKVAHLASLNIRARPAASMPTAPTLDGGEQWTNNEE
jgi:hypothetical protein